MTIKEKVIDFLESQSLEYFTKDELANRLGIGDSFSYKEIGTILDELVADGELVKNNKKKYVCPKVIGLIRGEISSSDRGFAFLIPEDKDIDDIFIPPQGLNGAYHKDIVLVKLLSGKSGQKSEAEVHTVIRRGLKELVGTYYKSGHYGFVIPDNKYFSSDIYIAENEKTKIKPNNNCKVVVKITEYPTSDKKNPSGVITEIIGDKNTPRLEFLSILKAYGLNLKFDDKVLNASKNIPEKVMESDKIGRVDFTDIVTVTIDGDDAKDFDDAISIEQLSNGNFKLGVHIADVSHYVESNSVIDEEAHKRATSVYLPSLTLPMLPERLSNGICSLQEGVERLTLSAIMEVDGNGKVIDFQFVNGVIKSSGRLTYEKVSRFYENDEKIKKEYGHIGKELWLMHKLCGVLTVQREKRGSIDFELPESKIVVDKDDNVVEVNPYNYSVANRIIEEFMILANSTVAEYICHMELPFAYRVHECPSDEKLKSFMSFLRGFGVKFKMGQDVHPKEFADLLARLKGEDYYTVVNKVMLRSMQKAKYFSENIGHFGLALEFYCHFTSPIRRYADLTVHRILKKVIAGEFSNKVQSYYNAVISEICNNCSIKSKNADEVEREVDDYYKAKFMLDKIGNKYEGIISGVTAFGIFVELKNTIEGLIRLENLPRDNYNYNEGSYQLLGVHNKFRLGDKIKIIVKDVTMATRKIEFLFDEGKEGRNENPSYKQKS